MEGADTARILVETKQGNRKQKENIESRDTFRLTDEEYDVTLKGFCGHNELLAYRPPQNTDVGSGNWIMIKSQIPVSEKYKPETWSIYWATPTKDSKNQDGYDKYGRYKVDVIVKVKGSDTVERVSLFPHEYFVVSDEALQVYIEEGYQAYPINYSEEPALNLELIQRGKELTEEEREIIFALQVDGLTENEACQEYFLSRHVQTENYNMFYKPSDELLETIICWFGDGVSS